eukprot:ANDGO_06630.mRNA.1 hypothetical protein
MVKQYLQVEAYLAKRARELNTDHLLMDATSIARVIGIMHSVCANNVLDTKNVFESAPSSDRIVEGDEDTVLQILFQNKTRGIHPRNVVLADYHLSLLRYII